MAARKDALPLPADVAAPLSRSWTEAEAFAYCTTLTTSHYENFPVGSLLAPKALQPAIHSLYAFMRTADDFSDENRQPGDEPVRSAYLTSWGRLLDECIQTTVPAGTPRHPIFVALRATVMKYGLPVQWLRDLLSAFSMDVTVRRYATYADVLNYCRYSANPVGRLILTLFGYRSEELYRLSDSICTGLQLANHWQDVAIDLKKDRIYVPQEDMARFGVREEWLFAQSKPHPPAPSPTTQVAGGEAFFRELMRFEVDRAKALFREGQSLPERVQGRLRYELRLTWAGGYKILEKIERANYDVFRHRPEVTKWDWVGIFFNVVIPRIRRRGIHVDVKIDSPLPPAGNDRME